VKRSATLLPLSREHHSALSLARRIRLADGDVAHQALMTEVRQRHEVPLLAHFTEEERLIAAPLGQSRPELVQRFAAEHAALRDGLRRIAADDRSALVPFAELLAAHVRFEERELFPAFEACRDNEGAAQR
jgi:hypothetical protein